MTHIRFHRDTKGRITAFEAQGHSGAAPHGEDVVCAALSALLQAAAFSLEFYDDRVSSQIAPGHLLCTIPEGVSHSEEIHTVLLHTLLAIMNIALLQPQYVTLVIGELPQWQQLWQGDQVLTVLRQVFL